MKTQRLAFSQLHEELEVLERENLRGIKGGNGSQGEVTAWLAQQYGVPVESSYDENGNWIVSIDGGPWRKLVFQLESVEIVGTTTSFIKPEHFGFFIDPSGHASWEFIPGGGTQTPPPSIDTTRVDFVGGYIETLTLGHMDAYNFLDGMQNGLTLAGIAVSAGGLQNLTTGAFTLLGAMITFQGLAWSNIETNYMNSGNQGITIEKMVMSGGSMPTPYVTYIIKGSNGDELGRASGPGW